MTAATVPDHFPMPGPEWQAGYEAAKRQAVEKHKKASAFFARADRPGMAAIHRAWADAFSNMEATDGV